MKTLATLPAKELYDVIRFPADTSGEHIPDPDGGGRKPVLTLHTYSGFSFFSFFGSRGFPWGSLFHNCAGTYKDQVKDCKAVVLAYFVKGQAKVCIEVNPKQKAIVQAKLPCNRIVGEGPEMLAIIKNWARRKRLAVATLDMEEVRAANVN